MKTTLLSIHHSALRALHSALYEVETRGLRGAGRSPAIEPAGGLVAAGLRGLAARRRRLLRAAARRGDGRLHRDGRRPRHGLAFERAPRRERLLEDADGLPHRG